MITRPSAAAAIFALAVVGTSVYAGTAAPSGTDAAIEQLRKDTRTETKDIIDGTMEFSTDEAAKFWPLYKKYETQRRAIGDEKVALIKEFAANFKALQDDKAKELLGRLVSVEDKTSAAKRQFVQDLLKVLPAKTVARYYQVDNRIDMLVNLELASELPIIK